MLRSEFFEKMRTGIAEIPNAFLQRRAAALWPKLEQALALELPEDIPGHACVRWVEADPELGQEATFWLEWVHPHYRVGLVWDGGNEDSWFFVTLRGAPDSSSSGWLREATDFAKGLERWLEELAFLKKHQG